MATILAQQPLSLETNNMSIHKNKQKGFAALFIVLLLGFFAVALTVSGSEKGWVESKSVTEVAEADQARFAALSCLEIVRQKITDNQVPDRIPGSYFSGNKQCAIDNVSEYSGRAYAQVSSHWQWGTVTLESIVNLANQKILSISEH